MFYGDAEYVLAKVPRRDIPMILHETRDKTVPGQPGPTRLYSESGMAKLVRRLREEAGLPMTFTLDACRHGSMTELEEAELTDGQGRAYRLTRVERMRLTPNEQWKEHLRRRGSGMRIG